MGKGTPSMGKRAGKTLHIRCRRCGKRAYNVSKKRCGACGYGKSTAIKQYAWKTRNLRRERTS
ncbi:50S ribosomal protein L37e [Candidatus Bathyarchaeota archaeon]|nr:50S ribosomal protein L37e [Candidatus Bathyarchaeota archaeon]MCK4482754.1 50S ribosomal protein L37e [Candidatus Bathyarchaeota archaeon]